MAPIEMLLSESEHAAAEPLQLKSKSLEEPRFEAEPSLLAPCQVCFDGVDTANASASVTFFCGPSCPAVLCVTCLASHVRVAVAAAFHGILPRVRCPICLIAVPKARWQGLVADDSVMAKYVKLCQLACSFRTPCCENADYTHLPVSPTETRPSRYIEPEALTLENAEAQTAFSQLQTLATRFGNHEETSITVITRVEAMFGDHGQALPRQHLVMEHLLQGIDDEERRATLLLAYHARYRIVTTRCCGGSICFNCKRYVNAHRDPNVCDEQEITDDCILECRACRVTMVKVEGCSSVTCWCGFAMNWSTELSLRNRNRRQLIPVDIFDLELYERWTTQKKWLTDFVSYELVPLRLAIRLSRLDLEIPLFRRPLQVMLQRYIWRWRWQHGRAQLETEMHGARLSHLVLRLARSHRLKDRVVHVAVQKRAQKVRNELSKRAFWLQFYEQRTRALTEVHEDERALLLEKLFE